MRLFGGDLLDYVKYYFPKNINNVIEISTGENNKNIEAVVKVCHQAQAAGVDRHALFVAVGGGILTDVVAFAASMFRRRTDCIKIGTTLVAQVDASIGVKCGVNLGKSKNLLGAFHLSNRVIVDHHFLTTLPSRHIRGGLAEIIKLAIVRDRSLFELVEQHYQEFLTNQVEIHSVLMVINQSIVSMVSELATNPTESKLKRAVDFGHTFSPYIESASNFQISHGEAVGIDLALTSVVAHLLGHLPLSDLQRILHILYKVGLPLFSELLTSTELYSSLHHVELHRGNRLNMPIPTSIGTCAFLEDLVQLPSPVVNEAINYLQSYSMEKGTQNSGGYVNPKK